MTVNYISVVLSNYIKQLSFLLSYIYTYTYLINYDKKTDIPFEFIVNY